MTTAKRWAAIPLLLAAVPLAPGTLTAQQFPPDEPLETMLRYMVEDGVAGAVSLGLLEADGAARVVQYGTGADGRPLAEGARFEIGEVTMTLTATLLAGMAARGEVSLDDPVSRYLPPEVRVPTERGREITLDDLARHRSGLPPGPQHPDASFALDDLYDAVSGARLEFVPGAGREFSRLGYGLLGHALARASGRPFAELLRERVLDPLGMASTGYTVDAGGEAAVEGTRRGEATAAVEVSEALQGATGLRSTAADLLRFLAANAGAAETSLQRAMKVAQEVHHPDPEGEGFGFSWRTYTAARQPLLLTHGGRTAGFTALVSLDPESGAGTVMLVNAGGFNDWIARDLLYPDSQAQLREITEADPEILAAYAGAYESRPGTVPGRFEGRRYFVRLEDDGSLSYQPSHGVRTPLYPRADGSFLMLRAPLTVTFDRDGDDVRMRIHVDEREGQTAGGGWTAWKVDDATPLPAVVAGTTGTGPGSRAGAWVLIGLLGVGVAGAVLGPLRSG